MATALILVMLVVGIALLAAGIGMAHLTITTLRQVRTTMNSLHQKIESERVPRPTADPGALHTDWNSQSAQRQRYPGNH